MKSISTRLATWYALAATVTLACLFVVGYQLLERYLIHGLDMLNAAEFQQIRARLGPDYVTLEAADIDTRIRETTEYASVLFYIDIERHIPGAPRDKVMFISSNLHGQEIPDVKGKTVYDTWINGIGSLRVAEFLLADFGDVTIATPSDHVITVMEGYVEVCSSLLAAMLVVSVAVGFVLSRLALRPVRLIRETASRIGSDNLSERIPVGEVRDEVSELARLLNQMFDRLEYSFNQIRRFTGEASHELKTPLSLIRLQAEKLLVTGDLAPAQEEAVQMQLEELARLSRIIEELLFLSRAEARAITLQLNSQDPSRFLQSFAQDARVLAEHHGCHFALVCEGQGTVAFEEKRIHQVLLNLVANALDASPDDGVITISSTVTGQVWRVSVEDRGRGVPADQYERIFERFVRLENRGADDTGSGLGLAICRSIIELHRGRIHAESGTNGHGLRVVFEIPATQIVVSATAESTRASAAVETVL